MAIWSPKLRMNTMAPTKRPAARSRFCGAGAGEGRVSARAGRVCGQTDDDLDRGDGDARTEGMDARGSRTHHGALAVRAGELPIDDVLETHDRLREGGMRRGGPGPRGFPGAWSRPRCVVSAHAGVSAGGRNADSVSVPWHHRRTVRAFDGRTRVVPVTATDARRATQRVSHRHIPRRRRPHGHAARARAASEVISVSPPVREIQKRDQP